MISSFLSLILWENFQSNLQLGFGVVAIWVIYMSISIKELKMFDLIIQRVMR